MSWLKEELSFHEQQRLLLKLADKVKAFAGMSTAEIAELLSSAEKCSYAPMNEIVTEGNVGQHMYLIISGEAKVTKQGREGGVELARLAAADSFGEMSLIDQVPRSATVIAVSPCLLVRLSEKSLEVRPEIAAKIYLNLARILASRLREADELLAWRI